MAWWDQQDKKINRAATPDKSTSAYNNSALTREADWAQRGADMLDNQRTSEMNRLITKFQQYGDVKNVGKQSNIGEKIRGLGSNFEGLDMDALLNSLYAKPGSEGYYDPSQYAWSGQATTPTPGTTAALDVNMGSTLDELANVPGTNELSTSMPPWLQLDKNDNWKDIANANQVAQWIESQRRNAGQDRAANVAAQQMENAQRLGETQVISDEDVARLLGRQAGQLGGIEQQTQRAIQDAMGARGMAPGSGIGAGMAGKAAIQRQMGLAQAGNDLGTQQMIQNRSGLERALGLESNAASNLQNVLTGYGTQQWNMPAPDYWNALQNPVSAGSATSPGAGALSGAASGAMAGTAVMPGWGTAAGALIGGAAGYFGNR